MFSSLPRSASFRALRVAIIYMLLAMLWIFFSDQAVQVISQDVATATVLSTYKGAFFVLMSGLILLILIRREFASEERATQALHTSEERLNRLVETVPNGITIVNQHGQITFANQNAKTILGLEINNATLTYNDPHWQITTPEGAPIPDEELPFSRVMRERKRLIGFEHTIFHPTLGWRVLRVDAAPLLDHLGQPAGVVASIDDVTQFYQAQAAAREREQNYRLLFENAPVGVAYYNNDFGMVDCNEYMAKMLRTDRKNLIGNDLKTRKDQSIQSCYAEALQGRQGYFEGLYHTTSSDMDLWLIARTAPLWDAQGHILGGIVIYEDLTERHRAEIELQRQLKRLGALREVDTAINALRGLPQVLHVFLDQVVGMLNVDAAAVVRYDAQTHTSLSFVSRGLAIKDTPEMHRVFSDLLIEPVMSSGQRYFVHGAPLTNLTGFLEFVGAPLVSHGQVIGVLGVFCVGCLPCDDDWLHFLDMLAGQATIAIEHTELYDGLQKSSQELLDAYESTLEGWANALELRDRETEGHSQRVTELTLRLARKMNVPEAELAHLRRGALLHDIGKLGVPDQILLKPGKLNAEEWQTMSLHPVFGYQWLANIPFLQRAAEIVYNHHEKWDGTGYPRHLKGEEIPLSARMFAVVDVWDALSNDRPYRPAWPREMILEYIRQSSGSHFDPKVVRAFFALFEFAENESGRDEDANRNVD